MTRPEIEATILDIIRTVFNLTKTPPPTTKRIDLPQWDSLRHIDLILSLEEAFQVEFNAEEVAAMDSVQSIVELVLERSRAP